MAATVKKATENSYVTRRLKKAKGVVIDEISMISGIQLQCAELIARRARKNDSPWGGLKVIVVGDFSQLPPVSHTGAKDWAFMSPTWMDSGFDVVTLHKIMRTTDAEFLEVLNLVRVGTVNQKVIRFLDGKVSQDGDFQDWTLLFPRRFEVDAYNSKRLAQIKGELHEFPTEYKAKDPKNLDALKKNAPIPEVLFLKEGALVMIRQNDPENRWVNGSLGIIKEITKDQITVKLMTGRKAELEPFSFTLLDGDGNEQAVAKNFPITVAYATTIHKAQGMSLDRVRVDLSGAWEHGQAYVALSRARSAEGLSLVGWSPRSIVVDGAVRGMQEVREEFEVEEPGGHEIYF